MKILIVKYKKINIDCKGFTSLRDITEVALNSISTELIK